MLYDVRGHVQHKRTVLQTCLLNDPLYSRVTIC